MPTVTTTVEDTSPVFQWSVPDWVAGGWQDPYISRYSQSSCMATNVSGATMSFTFFGKSVKIYGAKRANHGWFQVEIDNKTYEAVNGSMADPGEFQQQLFSMDKLENARHEVKVVNLNETLFLDVDFVTWTTDIGDDDEDLVVHTVQDSSPAIVWNLPSAWQTGGDKMGTYFGSSGHVSSTPGSSMEYKFTGSAVYLYGSVGPDGALYSVTLDGQPMQNYTSNSSISVPQTLLYYAGGLDGGSHTINVTHSAWGAVPATTQVLGIDFLNLYTTPSIEALSIDRLSPQAIAGITVGTIAGLIIFLILITYHLWRRNSAHDRNRDREQEQKGRSRSRSGWWRVLSAWAWSGPIAKLKKKRKLRNGQPFDIDGVDYARVGTSERETSYLIPEYGPPGASGSGGGGVRGSSTQPSVFSSVAESSGAPSHSTGGSDPKLSSLSGLSLLSQPAVTEMGMRNAGPSNQRPGTGGSSSSAQRSSVAFGGSTAQRPGTGGSSSSAQRLGGPTAQRPGTGGSSSSAQRLGGPTAQRPGTSGSSSSAQGSSVVLKVSTAALSSSSQSESSTSSRRYSRVNSMMIPPSPLGARPMSSHSQLQSPQAQSPSLQRIPTILPPLPPGAAKPLAQVELASTTSEIGELDRGRSVGNKQPPEYDSGPDHRQAVGDKKGTLG